jgi:hypothetical protein
MKIKLSINIQNPTLDDVKKVLKFSADYAKSKTFKMTRDFKEKRRKRFPKTVRFERFGDYLSYTIEELKKLQNNMMDMQR